MRTSALEKLLCLLRVVSTHWRYRTADARIGNPGIQRPMTTDGRCGRIPDLDCGVSQCLFGVDCRHAPLPKRAVLNRRNQTVVVSSNCDYYKLELLDRCRDTP